MSATHGEIVNFLAEEIELITRACLGRVHAKKRTDDEDDAHANLVDSLDRWGDRKYPQIKEN